MFLGTVLLFAGYTLIYAGVARGGVFATEPWNGVLYDAYIVVPVQQVANAVAAGLSQGTSGGFTRPRQTPAAGTNTAAPSSNSTAGSGTPPAAPSAPTAPAAPRFSFTLPQSPSGTRPRLPAGIGAGLAQLGS